MKRRHFAIVEDTEAYRTALSETLSRDGVVKTFDCPDSFAEAFRSPQDLAGYELIVLDYSFDRFDASNKDLVTYIRSDLQYRKRLVLWSVEDDFPASFLSQVDAVLPKRLMTFPEIEQCIAQQ